MFDLGCYENLTSLGDRSKSHDDVVGEVEV